MKKRNFIITTILLALGFLALCSVAQAVSPAPDGGYPGLNTAEGQNALLSLTTGQGNTAVGWFSLRGNAAGSFNTATGAGTLLLNTSGSGNTATGAAALLNNTNGGDNTANGVSALQSNTGGGFNTATGFQALFNNTANGNTANGFNALAANSIGSFNTATGTGALFNNTTGNDNTANGDDALVNNSTGSSNIAMGNGAGSNLTTGDLNIDIGAFGVAGESATIRIGRSADQTRTFIAGITGVAVTGAPVVVDGSGQLGVAPSSWRFKRKVKPMAQTSEAILALKPVTFQYKSDPAGMRQFGLIAEEVAEVNPDLVVRGADGEIYTVRYDAINAMLLNEFLKEHHKVEEQQATIAELKSTVAQQQKDFQATAAHQQKQIEVLSAGLQKVSAQLEASKPAPQIANNP
jgi:Chaperone of endosialidase